MARRSPTQLAALRLIAEGSVKVHEYRIGRDIRVSASDGRSIRASTYHSLVRAGLVNRDATTSLHAGQPVTLTDAGRAELAAPPAAPRIEIVVVRDPDTETFLKYFRDGVEVSAEALGVTELHVDPGASGADWEWVHSMERAATLASEAAGSYLREQIGVYAPAYAGRDAVGLAAAVLAGTHQAVTLNEYGRCTAPGFRIEGGSENRARVSHQLVPIDLTDPDRPDSHARWTEQGERVAEYAETFAALGWRVERRVPTTGPFLLVTPPDERELTSQETGERENSLLYWLGPRTDADTGR